MIFSDTHTHLFDKAFDMDRSVSIQKAIDNGVSKMFLPNVDLHSIQPMLDVVWEFPENCFPMMGLHPCDVNEHYLDALKLMHAWFKKRKFFGVGEIGLDYYWSQEFKEKQKDAFLIQLNWGIEFDLPVIIHSRESIDDCIAMVEPLSKKGLRGIFHCFTGTIAQAEKIIACGFYLGIGGVLTYKNSGLADVIKDIPLEHLVLETDAPYLAPVPHRGKRNESFYLKEIAHKLAEVKQCGIKSIADITTENSKKIFGI